MDFPTGMFWLYCMSIISCAPAVQAVFIIILVDIWYVVYEVTYFEIVHVLRPGVS